MTIKIKDMTPEKQEIKLICGENLHILMDIPF